MLRFGLSIELILLLAAIGCDTSDKIARLEKQSGITSGDEKGSATGAYDLQRHTFATDLLSKGLPSSEFTAILGNSTRIVEKHYTQWI